MHARRENVEYPDWNLRISVRNQEVLMPKRCLSLNAWSKMKPMRDENAQVLVVFVPALGLLLSFMALAFDVGQFLSVKRQMQTAADAAALAGALEVQQCGSTSNCTVMQTAAKSAIAEEGLGTPTLVKQCATNSATGLTLELNNGPCLLGTNDPNHGNTKYVEAVVSYQQPALLAKIVGLGSVTIAARSEAFAGNPLSCVDVLDPAASPSMTMNSGSSVTASCGVAVNSTGSPALTVNSGTTLTATSINVTGGDLVNGSPTMSPSPTLGAAAVADPFASLAAPSTTPCGATTSSPYTGAPGNQSMSGTVTFNPGVYCGGINMNGSTTATFTPGTYVFTGPVNVGTGSSMTGNGVTFYFSSGSLTMNSGTSENLVAPTSGTYAGILIDQDKSDTSAMILNTDSSSVLQGAIYLPKAQLTINGGGNLAAYTFLAVDTLMMNGTFNLGNNYSSLPNGPPVPSSGAVLTE
jgi:hypothetical protein